MTGKRRNGQRHFNIVFFAPSATVKRRNFTKVIQFVLPVTFLRQLGILDTDFVVLLCGRFMEEKGLLELMKAVLQTGKKSGFF